MEPPFLRDDDINVYTCVEEFRRIHSVFQKHNRIHTVVCEMNRLWENKSLFWLLLTDPLINVELHGLEHTDYSITGDHIMRHDLWMAIDYWETNAKRMLGVNELSSLKTITTFFPPWNKIAPYTESVCKELNLRLSYKQEDCKWMFHWWATTPEEVEMRLR